MNRLMKLIIVSLFLGISEREEEVALALNEMQKKLSEELEGLEQVLAAAHAKELDQLQKTIAQQVRSFIYFICLPYTVDKG
jgi:hypothetical protein